MNRLLCVSCAAFGLAVCGSDLTVSVDDEDVEEIVIRKRKIKKEPPAPSLKSDSAVPPAPDPLPVVVAPVASEPPPPPEPPVAEAAEPRRLIRYFCKMWKDQDWERMWWAMSPQYRKTVTLKKFTGLFSDDAEANGGLSDENILDEGETNLGVGLKVELTFKFRKAKHRVVKAEVQRQPGGQYRVVGSPIIPMDLDDL